MSRFQKSGDARTSGDLSENAGGNGSIMRMAQYRSAMRDYSQMMDELIEKLIECSQYIEEVMSKVLDANQWQLIRGPESQWFT